VNLLASNRNERAGPVYLSLVSTILALLTLLPSIESALQVVIALTSSLTLAWAVWVPSATPPRWIPDWCLRITGVCASISLCCSLGSFDLLTLASLSLSWLVCPFCIVGLVLYRKDYDLQDILYLFSGIGALWYVALQTLSF